MFRPPSDRLITFTTVRNGLACAILLFCLVVDVRAQDSTRSLTKEFPKLSAKERARIAAREADEAKQDQVYQGVMGSGEKAFQEGHYEEAVRLFEQARGMRPYNVYPKVKIEDLKALMAKQAAAPNEPAPGDPVAIPTTKAADSGSIPPALSPNAPDAPSDRLEPPAETTQPGPRGPVADGQGIPVQAGAQARSLKKADGLIERRYKDGRAFVIERIVTVEGRAVTYKRVYHPFGQVFYFEDGLSVDERVWKARFSGR